MVQLFLTVVLSVYIKSQICTCTFLQISHILDAVLVVREGGGELGRARRVLVGYLFSNFASISFIIASMRRFPSLELTVQNRLTETFSFLIHSCTMERMMSPRGSVSSFLASMSTPTSRLTCWRRCSQVPAPKCGVRSVLSCNQLT